MTYIALAMRSTVPRHPGILLALALVASAAARADTAADAYRTMGIRPAEVLTGTVLRSRILPGGDKQVVSMTTYFTGKEDRADAVNVRLDVFRISGEQLEPVYTRDFGKENGGFVGEGELQLVDLDLDGISEIVASYASFADPLIDQRLGEVIFHDQEKGFRTAWAEPMAYDATRAAREVPLARRDRFEREIDLPKTLRTRGITLFVQKKVIAVAGERLSEPKLVQETFPLRTTEP